MSKKVEDYRPRTLECDNEHQFERLILHWRPVSDEGPDSGSVPLKWTLEESDLDDVQCPVCGSKSINLID